MNTELDKTKLVQSKKASERKAVKKAYEEVLGPFYFLNSTFLWRLFVEKTYEGVSYRMFHIFGLPVLFLKHTIDTFFALRQSFTDAGLQEKLLTLLRLILDLNVLFGQLTFGHIIHLL